MVRCCRLCVSQPSFELGVLAYEVCTGEHPVPDYPVDLDYAAEDLPGTAHAGTLVFVCVFRFRVFCVKGCSVSRASP